MKRLVITCILLIVALAGVLQGNYIAHERPNDIAISEAYKNVYPETLTFDLMANYPF
jgi:hypothetical protein